MLYNIPSAGFISQTLDALVEGILQSVALAHESMRPGKIYYNEGRLLEASINRSPTSYANNPLDERVNYKYNVDNMMYLLKLVDSASGRPMAVINWFAVHGTSMNSSNHLISSDNKGYASLLLEEEFNPPGTLPGKGKFVAIFAQANEGDVSPNTRGARCVDSGLPCDLATSTCGTPARNEKCIASGPGKDMFESTKIIAYKQFFKARELMADESGLQPVQGAVRYVHEHVDMTSQVVPLYKSVVDLAARQQPEPQISLNSSYETCEPGLGYSFAAGTTDGPGAFDFQQADTASSRYWNMVRDFLRRPSEVQMKCHHPKPILLSTGEMDFPYMWHPRIVPTQIIMIGQVAVVGLPGEFTTMSGRRVRNVVSHALKHGATLQASDVLEDSDDDDDEEFDDNNNNNDSLAPSGGESNDEHRLVKSAPIMSARAAIGSAAGTSSSSSSSSSALLKLTRYNKSNMRAGQAQSVNQIKVVLSGLSNVYTSYVTTLEEYEIQRYEGASTLYGPHTLQAYINQFRRLALHLVTDTQLLPDDQPQPPNLTKSLFTLKPGVLYDGAPHGHNFGSLLVDVNSTRVYKCGETISVSFVAGNPRNDLRQGDSFLYVDKYSPPSSNSTGGGGGWSTIATDASWETKFIWERTNTLLGESRATIVWETTPVKCQWGVFRIRHYGAHKNLLQTVSQYSGRSSLFMLADPERSNSVAHRVQLEALLKSAKEFDANQQQQAVMNQKRNGAEHQAHLNNNNVDSRAKLSLYAPLNLLSSLFNWRSQS